MELSKKVGKVWPELGKLVSDKTQISFFTRTWGNLGRAVLGSFAALIFGLVILFMSIMAATNPLSVAPFSPTPSLVPTMGVEVKEVQYYLPYPGILPDSPLYKLKSLRDWFTVNLTFDVLSRAKTELVFADKRINAAVFLVDGGKETLGISTATKAEKYLEKSVGDAIKLSGQGKDVKSLLLTLITASEKHMEILKNLQNKVTGEGKKVMQETYQTTLNWHQKSEQALRESK